jgi:hypothetical protein
MASACLARHAGFRDDGYHPLSDEWRFAPKNESTQNLATIASRPLIRWSMQEIRRVATKMARRQIQPAHIMAWSTWRRAHQAAARQAHLKSKMQL